MRGNSSFRTPLRLVAFGLSLLTVAGTGMSAASAAPLQPRPTVTRAVNGSVPLGKRIDMAASVKAGKTGVRGVHVELFRIAPSGRVHVATLVTGKAGSVHVLVKPTATARYYWRFSGTKGFAPSGTRVLIKVSHPAALLLGPRVVAEAAKHLGAAYVYGADGPRNFDCSGLTQYVFRRLGIRLPRTAAEQYAAVRHVSTGAKRVGDLIFFRLGGGRVDHVGIYAGHNQIVVAPKTGDHVRYETIWTSYSVGRVG